MVTDYLFGRFMEEFTMQSFALIWDLDGTLVDSYPAIVPALSGFPRKPAPDGIAYLMHKYALNAARCFYIGDRSLDMEEARNAGIQSILYRPAGSPVEPTGGETYIVRDLLEITALPGFRGDCIN